MIYVVIPAVIVSMLAYMFWSVAYRLRRDLVTEARKRDRSEIIFSRKHRVRYLLDRAFSVAPDEPDWQPKLVSRLGETERPAERV